MPRIQYNVRDGEATLMEKLFEDATLSAVLEEAKRRDLIPDRLEFTNVTKDNGRYRGAESLVQSPYIHLKGKLNGGDGRFGHLIVKKPEDEKYCLFEYHWTP
ncbi:hypothetical protein HY212_02805 [Candidatus Pacearchaeota archaeon]|nr:hypothetical protein [Candidatus Pacearchaeota archaeon]